MQQVRACTLCTDHLPLDPRPVLQAHPSAPILIVGQAPGVAAHRSGIPFDDPSGDRLRHWLGVDRTTFCDPARFALIPMGFCYPGRGQGGDLPPRPECAETWRQRLLTSLGSLQMTIYLGRHAIDWHLRPPRARALATIVADWRQHWPHVLPLPHPSPRNTRWLREHPWVEAEIVPALQERIRALLSQSSGT